MNEKTGNILKIIVGLFILDTVLYGYNFDFSHAYELTFVSNTSCGLLLLIDGIVSLIKKKSVPIFLYQCVLPCINTVFFSVFFKLFGWHDFNFYGGFFFMHGINPVIFLVLYLFSTNLIIKDKRDYIRRIFIAPIMMMTYLLFDFIRYVVTGKLVYGLIATENLNYISVPLIGVVFYLLMAFMSYGLLDLKMFVQKKITSYCDV